MSLHTLAWELTDRCNGAPADAVKATCRSIDPRYREAALRFFFESREWRRHRRLWRRFLRERSAVTQQTADNRFGGLALGRMMAATQNELGPSLDRCTEELAERFRAAQ